MVRQLGQCCRRIEVISWTDRLENEDALQRKGENKNILHTIKHTQKNNQTGQGTNSRHETNKLHIIIP